MGAVDANFCATSPFDARAAVANGSLAVFQAGVDGASSPYGHVAWVVAVSGSTFEIYEMNGTAGPYNWDYRWVNNVSGVSFIYW